MLKRTVALVTTVLLLVLMIPVAVFGNNVSLNLSTDTAEIGDSITASGTADANAWVAIKVVDDAGNIVFFDAVKATADGNYSCTFKVPVVQEGILNVVAGCGSNVETKTLTVRIPTTQVSLNLSADTALVGDSITASGTADADTWVSIKVVDNAGNIVFFDAVKAMADGNYSCIFKVPAVQEGILNVVAGCGSNVETKTLTVRIPTTQVSLSLSADTALVGDEITASGTADANTWVSIKVVDGTGNIVFFDAVKADADGSYTKTFKVPTVPTGTTLVVTAGYGDNVATKSLIIQGSVTPTLSSIAITNPATKLVYTVGEELDLTGLVVTGTYSDGSTKEETITAANVTGFDSSEPVAEQVLTITVGDKTATYTIEIKAVPVVTLSSIAITHPADKLVYTVGDELDLTGLVVTGTYSDGSIKEETITTANVTGFDSSEPVAEQVLTITVGGKIATYTVEIKAAPITLSKIAITNPATKLVYTVGEELDLTGLVVKGTYSDGSTKEETITAANVTGFDSSKPVAEQVLTITVDGKTTTYTVTITKLEMISNKQKIITITPDTPVTITVPKNTKGAKIAVNKAEPLPLVAVETTTPQGTTVEMRIPAGTEIINPPADWDGTITLPEVKVKPTTIPVQAQKVTAVIEVGLPDKEITFDKAVRLLVPGQKGKSAGYIRNGEFTQITYTITKDDQVTADEELVDKIRDGQVDVGNDLAIWTKHFTEFIAYTPVTTKGSSGGGGSISDSKTISPEGGTVKIAGAELYFPADAVTNKIKVTTKKLRSGITAVSSEFKLVSDVYEITSDKNNEFKKPVTITLPFDRNKVDNDKYDVGIYCWNNKQWVILDEVKVDIAAGKVSGEVNHFSKFAVLASEKAKTPVDEEQEPIQEPTKPVLTDITGHWAEANISKLVAAGAISGYPDGTFKPDNTISRAEFDTILVRAFKLEPKNGKIFTDTANHWARESIATAAANGIVKGYSDTTFGPNDNITREQMAVMIAKAAKLTNVAEGKTFADSVQISDWAKDAVARASGDGIVSGYPDNTFKPKATATRAEAVTVIVKAL